MKIKPVPIDIIKQRYSYDPETGIFKRLLNDRVALPGPQGYVYIFLRKAERYMAHRVAWKWMTGNDPCEEIDHINGVRDDNRISNLREVTRRQNNANTPVRNSTGYKGVRYEPRLRSGKNWTAKTTFNRKAYYIGAFETAEEAGLAYEVVAEMVQGHYAAHISRRNAV